MNIAELKKIIGLIQELGMAIEHIENKGAGVSEHDVGVYFGLQKKLKNLGTAPQDLEGMLFFRLQARLAGQASLNVFDQLYSARIERLYRKILRVLDPKKIHKAQFSEDDIKSAKSVSILSAAESLGIEINKRFCKCIFHNEKTASLALYDKTSSFYCFGCGKGGDVIDLVMKKMGISFFEAVTWLIAKK